VILWSPTVATTEPASSACAARILITHVIAIAPENRALAASALKICLNPDGRISDQPTKWVEFGNFIYYVARSLIDVIRTRVSRGEGCCREACAHGASPMALGVQLEVALLRKLEVVGARTALRVVTRRTEYRCFAQPLRAGGAPVNGLIKKRESAAILQDFYLLFGDTTAEKLQLAQQFEHKITAEIKLKSQYSRVNHFV
jgi:hypothetical protein